MHSIRHLLAAATLLTACVEPGSYIEEDTLQVQFTNEAPGGTATFEGRTRWCIRGAETEQDAGCDAVVDGQAITVSTWWDWYDGDIMFANDCGVSDVIARCEVTGLSEGTYEVHYADEVATLDVDGDGSTLCLPADQCEEGYLEPRASEADE